MQRENILSDRDELREGRMKRLYNCVVAQDISTSGKYLFTATRYGDIFVQSIDNLQDIEKTGSMKPMKCYKSTTKLVIKCMKYHPHGLLIVGTVGLIYTLSWLEDQCELIDKPSWYFYLPLRHCDRYLPVVNSIWIRSRNARLLIGCSNSILYEVCLESKSMVRYYKGHKDSILNVCSPIENGRQIYTASEDGTVRIWSSNERNASIILEPYKDSALARPYFGKWISSIATKGAQWLICGGGPKLALWHLNSRHYTNVYNFPSANNVCEIVEDLIVTGGQHKNLLIYKLNGEKWSDICTENTSIYSVVSTTKPYHFMSVAGFSNSLTILQNDFRYSDASIELYT